MGSVNIPTGWYEARSEAAEEAIDARGDRHGSLGSPPLTPRPPAPETRDRLLAAAQRLLRRRGFAATTVDDICREAELTKGAFFHYFATKEDLGVAAIERFGEERLAAMRRFPGLAAVDPRDRVEAWLSLLGSVGREPALAEGCLLGNLGQELAHTNPRLRDAVAVRFAIWRDALEEELAAAKARYAPAAPWEPASVARLLILTFEGAILLGKTDGDPDLLEDSFEHLRRYLRSLLEAPSAPSAPRAGRASRAEPTAEPPARRRRPAPAGKSKVTAKTGTAAKTRKGGKPR